MTTPTVLTRHGVEPAVQSPLLQAGFAVRAVAGFDTDITGTLAGETALTGSQLDAATTIAGLATELSGERYKLVNEFRQPGSRSFQRQQINS